MPKTEPPKIPPEKLLNDFLKEKKLKLSVNFSEPSWEKGDKGSFIVRFGDPTIGVSYK